MLQKKQRRRSFTRKKVIMDKESAGFVILVLIKRRIEFLASQ
ncbi:hypothetical protein HID58_061051 [Brassica napus]|uniref:Uncharacterized protein n=1 Tax=Brassica napus TaxID=3708 RepID=A0ABQ7ZXH8_BRANA|nr:hypothetical protein HID58_061051 [Brassica napus]